MPYAAFEHRYAPPMADHVRAILRRALKFHLLGNGLEELFL